MTIGAPFFAKQRGSGHLWLLAIRRGVKPYNARNRGYVEQGGQDVAK